MEFLREYAGGIIIVGVISILLENILPETADKKYIRVAIGLVVMLGVVSPLASFVKQKDVFVLPEIIIDDNDLSANANQYIHEDFKNRLSQTLSEHVYQKTGKSATVRVFIGVNEKGEITEISSIECYPYEHDIIEEISQLSGVETEKIKEGPAG
ncbi:MAG: stage III sporulation protein AF [Clostridia bacterium]|nr:stage III sporulation protein AF [Clostridia bacterium]